MAALACALTVLAVAAGQASAAPDTFTVNSVGDSAGACGVTCTLRSAITAANANGNPAEVDSIVFAGQGTITLASATPLPSPSEPVTINAALSSVQVTGSATYATACGPPATHFALDLTGSTATGSSVRHIAFNNVCGRAIKSDLPAPTVRVGPRRGDGTLPVSGTGPASATAADVFTTSGSLANGEATTYKASVPVGGGAFSYLPPGGPLPGDLFTATFTSAGSTSTFAARAGVPADIDSPLFVRAIAVTQTRVRLDFNESIAQGSLAPEDFTLVVSNLPRPVAGATAIGNSVFVDSQQPWLAGEGGYVSLTGSGAVTDLAGNEILGGPGGKVYAGPGDLEKPQIRSLKISPNKICKSKRPGCKRTTTRMRVSLTERARITTTIYRASTKSKRICRFRSRLEEGVSWVKIKNTMVGRRLPRGRMVVVVVAEDVARTVSDPAETIFEVR